jgi:xylulokinase
MSHILGIDIGTSGCKVTALDKDGTLIITVSREWFPTRHADGTSEQDPREWLETIASATAEVWAVGIDPKLTIAIGVTGQMQGATFIDERGEPVRPSILWDDTRSSDQTRQILAGRQAHIERTIGYGFSDGLTLGKLLWVREQEPENWARIATVLQATGYVTHALTGRRFSDVNNIGQSGMNDMASNSWSEWIVNEFSIPRSHATRGGAVHRGIGPYIRRRPPPWLTEWDTRRLRGRRFGSGELLPGPRWIFAHEGALGHRG